MGWVLGQCRQCRQAPGNVRQARTLTISQGICLVEPVPTAKWPAWAGMHDAWPTMFWKVPMLQGMQRWEPGPEKEPMGLQQEEQERGRGRRSALWHPGTRALGWCSLRSIVCCSRQAAGHARGSPGLAGGGTNSGEVARGAVGAGAGTGFGGKGSGGAGVAGFTAVASGIGAGGAQRVPGGSLSVHVCACWGDDAAGVGRGAIGAGVALGADGSAIAVSGRSGGAENAFGASRHICVRVGGAAARRR